MTYDRSRIAHVLFISSTLALSACGGSSSQNTPQQNTLPIAAAETLQQEVSFDLDLSALLEKEILPGTLNDQPSAANLMEGSMKVTNLASGDIEFFPWNVNIDESDLANVQSFQTLALEPGNYAFEIAVSKGSHSYSGSTIYELNDGDAELVSMTIRPVIGDTLLDTNIIAELIDFRFSFSASDINTANLANPSMGITINGKAEQIFALNQATGLSEHMLLNLEPGQHDISLRLLDNGIQVGKSIEAQENNITISQGLDVSMDIVPLHGEIAFSLNAEGEDANLSLQVPPEVIEEVGGIANLQTILRVTGPSYALDEQSISLTANGSSYAATVVLPDMYYGELTFEMTFTDTSDNNEIGYCFTSTLLNNASTSISCDLTLRRRQIVSGNLMSTLGINVSDVSGVSTPGAVISVGGQEVAITDGAAFSTPGYSSVYVTSGTHTVRAQLGTAFGEVEYTSAPLSVSNIAITLDRLDTDGDGIEDNLDDCPDVAADSANGCSSNIANDLLLSGYGNPNQVAVWLNDGQGGFTEIEENQSTNTNHEVAVGDFNQDGLDDIAAMRSSDGAVLVALAPFTNGLSLVQVGTKSGTRPRDIEAGDFNNDDVLDLVVAGNQNYSLFLGSGDGSFGSETTFSSASIDNRVLAVGDFDLDGNLDVTVNSNAGLSFLSIHYGDGTGNFPTTDTQSFPNLLNLHVKTADVDADGDLDILTAGYGYGFRLLTNNGNRNFTVGAEQYLPETFIFAEDFNGDGAADLVLANDTDDALLVRLNDGSGAFGDATTVSQIPDWARFGVSLDFNSDGKMDIAIPNNNVSTVTLVAGNGDGTFQVSQSVPGLTGNNAIAAGNFD